MTVLAGVEGTTSICRLNMRELVGNELVIGTHGNERKDEMKGVQDEHHAVSVAVERGTAGRRPIDSHEVYHA